MYRKAFFSKLAPFALVFASGLLIGNFTNRLDNGWRSNLSETRSFSTENSGASSEDVKQIEQLKNYDNARAKVKELKKQVCGGAEVEDEDGIFPLPLTEPEMKEEFKQK